MAASGDDEPRGAVKWRSLACLVLVELLAMSLWFSASAVVPQLQGEWTLTRFEAGWLTGGVQLGFVIGALASALLGLPDRFSNRALIAASAFLGAAATAAIPLAQAGPGGAILLRVVTGAALAGVYPPGMRLAATWSRRGRGLVIGMLVGALTLGSALPHLFNALPILGEGGLPPWRSVLLCAAALAALAGLIVLAGVREGPLLARAAAFDRRAAAATFRQRPLRLANLGYLGHMWELYAMWTWAPAFLMASYESAGLDLASARLAGFAAIAAGAPACVLAGLLADRIGRTRVAGASLALSGACCLIAGALFAWPIAATVVCIFWGFAVIADSAQFSAAISELAEPDAVGTALTVQTSLGFLLTLVSIQALPPLERALGWSGAFAVLALGPAVGLVAMVRLRGLPEAARMASGKR